MLTSGFISGLNQLGSVDRMRHWQRLANSRPFLLTGSSLTRSRHAGISLGLSRPFCKREVCGRMSSKRLSSAPRNSCLYRMSDSSRISGGIRGVSRSGIIHPIGCRFWRHLPAEICRGCSPSRRIRHRLQYRHSSGSADRRYGTSSQPQESAIPTLQSPSGQNRLGCVCA